MLSQRSIPWAFVLIRTASGFLIRTPVPFVRHEHSRVPHVPSAVIGVPGEALLAGVIVIGVPGEALLAGVIGTDVGYLLVAVMVRR